VARATAKSISSPTRSFPTTARQSIPTTQTYFFLSHDLEQSYQVRSHRKLFAYLSVYAEGAGNLNLSAFVDNEAYPTALTPLPLSSPAPKDLELPINLLGERVAFQLGHEHPGRMVPPRAIHPVAAARSVGPSPGRELATEAQRKEKLSTDAHR